MGQVNHEFASAWFESCGRSCEDTVARSHARLARRESLPGLITRSMLSEVRSCHVGSSAPYGQASCPQGWSASRSYHRLGDRKDNSKAMDRSAQSRRGEASYRGAIRYLGHYSE